MTGSTQTLLDVLHRNLQSIWDGDVDAYRATTSEDVTFFEWYISPQRIDGLDFHLRELAVHKTVVGDGSQQVEHEVLQPRIQLYGGTAIITYTLMIRATGAGGVQHKSHNETRVFHNFGTETQADWKLVHCHKSPVATSTSMAVLR